MLHCTVAVGAQNSRQEAFPEIARHSGEQCSIGFQPVFCGCTVDAFQAIDFGRGQVTGSRRQIVYKARGWGQEDFIGPPLRRFPTA
jgi:hypothetical protein